MELQGNKSAIYIDGRSLKNDGTPCRCYRKLFPPHCVGCGSKQVYSRENSERVFVIRGDNPLLLQAIGILREGTEAKNSLCHVKPDETVTIRCIGFRCRHCGSDFHILEPCEAPIEEKIKSSFVRDAMSLARTEAGQRAVASIAESGGSSYDIVEEALRHFGPKDFKPKEKTFEVPKASEAPDIFDLEAQAQESKKEEEK